MSSRWSSSSFSFLERKEVVVCNFYCWMMIMRGWGDVVVIILIIGLVFGMFWIGDGTKPMDGSKGAEMRSIGR